MNKPIVFDLTQGELRALNQMLHDLPEDSSTQFEVREPRGGHALACGVKAPVRIDVFGHTGYYTAGMNQQATVIIHGNTGVGVAENMMSGRVVVKGNASQSAGASGQGGLLVIEGDASARCGISMKGIDIVVKGSVGHMSAFMAQAGTLVICGDAGDALGDSLYEAKIFVRGKVSDLGADCQEEPMRAEDKAHLAALLKKAELSYAPKEFRRYGSARQLYNFHIDHASKY